jgi:transposase
MKFNTVLGIDVSLKNLDCWEYPSGRGFSVENTDEAIGALMEDSAGRSIEVIAVEATGGLERRVTRIARAAGFRVLVLNPARVRSFANLKGQIAKNDRIDAKVISEFAAHFGEDREPLPAEYEPLLECLTYHQQCSERVAQAKTCLASFSVPEICESQQSVVASLIEAKRLALATLRQRVAALPALKALVKLLSSMPGIGFLNAVNLAVRLPELGKLSRQAIASLAGLAPFDHDSGKFKGQRFIQGGRERIRTLLYMGGLTAVRVDPSFKAFYDRLVAKGKAHKLAITAVMRKMVTILNAMVRANKPWDTEKPCPP